MTLAEFSERVRQLFGKAEVAGLGLPAMIEVLEVSSRGKTDRL